MVLLPLQACKFLDEKWNPKFTLIIDQKKHHTKFFIPRKPDNVPPGNLHHLSVCCCNYVGHFLATLLYSPIIRHPLLFGAVATSGLIPYKKKEQVIIGVQRKQNFKTRFLMCKKMMRKNWLLFFPCLGQLELKLKPTNEFHVYDL